MRGLTILIAGRDEARLRSALGLALSHAALDGVVTVFFDTDAVAALNPPIRGTRDEEWLRAGLPALADLLSETLGAGVTMIVCQAGLAAAGLTMAALDPRFQAGGLIGVLAALGEDRFVTV